MMKVGKKKQTNLLYLLCKLDLPLLVYIALSQVRLIILKELIPVASEPRHCNLKPWFHATTVMQRCCSVDLCSFNSSILPQT